MKRLLLLCVLCLSGCITGEYEARQALIKEGFIGIRIGGIAWNRCGQNQKFGREFSAVNTNSKMAKIVNGVVCCGIISGCEVRF